MIQLVIFAQSYRTLTLFNKIIEGNKNYAFKNKHTMCLKCAWLLFFNRTQKNNDLKSITRKYC